MTEPALHRRGVARWRVLVVVAAAVALLAGCDLATGTVRTATELEEAGIRNPNLQYDGGTATLEYDADPNPLEARAEQEQAAAVIWRNLPFRIDEIVLTDAGGGFPSREYPRALLEQQLGPRPEGLDRSVEDIARRATLVAVVVALVVLVLIIVVIVLVVRAVRRRPTPPAGRPLGPARRSPAVGPAPAGPAGLGPAPAGPAVVGPAAGRAARPGPAAVGRPAARGGAAVAGTGRYPAPGAGAAATAGGRAAGACPAGLRVSSRARRPGTGPGSGGRWPAGPPPARPRWPWPGRPPQTAVSASA